VGKWSWRDEGEEGSAVTGAEMSGAGTPGKKDVMTQIKSMLLGSPKKATASEEAEAGHGREGSQGVKDPTVPVAAVRDEEEVPIGRHLIERQRRITPFNDFSSSSLLPTDPKPLSWSDQEKGGDPSVAHIEPDDWELVATEDPDGWQYALNWGFRLNAKCSVGDFVRMRRWVRKEERGGACKIGGGDRGEVCDEHTLERAMSDAEERFSRDIRTGRDLEDSDDDSENGEPDQQQQQQQQQQNQDQSQSRQQSPAKATAPAQDKQGLGRAVAAACVAEGFGNEKKNSVGSDLSGSVVKMIGGLRNAAEDNLNYFSSLAIKWKNFSTLMVELLLVIADLEASVAKIASLGAQNDAGDVVGNGYWSLLRVLHCCLRKMRSKVVSITSERDSIFFQARSSTLLGPAKEYLGILKILSQSISLALQFNEPSALNASSSQQQDTVSDWGSPVDAADTATRTPSGGLNGHGGDISWADGLVKTGVDIDLVDEVIDSMDLSVIYGEKFGYQYPMRLRHFLRVIILATASFSEAHESHQDDGILTQLAASYFHGLRYFVQPTKRANRITQQNTAMDINFVKRFWNLTELPIATKFMVVVAAHLEVIRVMNVDCSMPISFPRLASDGGGYVNVSVGGPDSDYDHFISPEYKPPSVIPTRLLCARARQGHELTTVQGTRMPWESTPAPPSPNLIVHFHGGGFIAQSSASHEIYLRDWAKQIDAPIFSVDYSLAPEHPFPVAVDQCFYAYCWALQNANLLGSTAQTVICVGDSAGANLATVVAFRAVEEGIKRPSAVIALYPALFLSLAPSPSRVLSIMDPLLPLANLRLCILAYASKAIEKHPKETSDILAARSGLAGDLTAAQRRRMHHLSPVLAPDSLLLQVNKNHSPDPALLKRKAPFLVPFLVLPRCGFHALKTTKCPIRKPEWGSRPPHRSTSTVDSPD